MGVFTPCQNRSAPVSPWVYVGHFWSHRGPHAAAETHFVSGSLVLKVVLTGRKLQSILGRSCDENEVTFIFFFFSLVPHVPARHRRSRVCGSPPPGNDLLWRASRPVGIQMSTRRRGSRPFSVWDFSRAGRESPGFPSKRSERATL